MTTTSITHSSVTPEDLHAWFNGGMDVPCQVFTPYRNRCGDPANWIMIFISQCECLSLKSILICDSCRQNAIDNALACIQCEQKIQVRWMERTR